MSFRNNKNGQWSNDNRNDRRTTNSSFRKNNRNFYNNYKWNPNSNNNNKSQNFGSSSHRNNPDYNNTNWSRGLYNDSRRGDGPGSSSRSDMERYSPPFNNQPSLVWNRDSNYSSMYRNNDWPDRYSSNLDYQQISDIDQPNLFERRNKSRFTDSDQTINQCPSTAVSNSNYVESRMEMANAMEIVEPFEPVISTIEPPLSKKSNVSTIENNKSNSTIRSPTPLSCNAEQVTKKLIHQLTSMDKHNLKQMINNPNSKFDTVLQSQARKKLRAEMRKQLRNISSADGDNQLLLDPDECIDSDKIPETVFDEIGRVLDINLMGNDFSTNFDGRCENDENNSDNKEDLYLRAERLLMENTFLLEDRLNDTNSNINSRSNSPICESNEIVDENPIKTNNSGQQQAINFMNISNDCLDNGKPFDDHFIDILDDTNANDPNVSFPKLQNLSFLSTSEVINENVTSPPQRNEIKVEEIIDTNYKTNLFESPSSEIETRQTLRNSDANNTTKINKQVSLKETNPFNSTTAKQRYKHEQSNKIQKVVNKNEDSLEIKKTDLITKLRNLDAMKSSAAEKKLKKLSAIQQRTKSPKSSKKRKRSKEKRKEKSKSHRDKYSLTSERKRHKSSSRNSRSRSSSISSSSDDNDRVKHISSKNSKTSKPKSIETNTPTYTPEPVIEPLKSTNNLEKREIVKNIDSPLTSISTVNDESSCATLDETFKTTEKDYEKGTINENSELLIEKEFSTNIDDTNTKNNIQESLENTENICDETENIKELAKTVCAEDKVEEKSFLDKSESVNNIIEDFEQKDLSQNKENFSENLKKNCKSPACHIDKNNEIKSTAILVSGEPSTDISKSNDFIEPCDDNDDIVLIETVNEIIEIKDDEINETTKTIKTAIQLEIEETTKKSSDFSCAQNSDKVNPSTQKCSEDLNDKDDGIQKKQIALKDVEINIEIETNLENQQIPTETQKENLLDKNDSLAVQENTIEIADTVLNKVKDPVEPIAKINDPVEPIAKINDPVEPIAKKNDPVEPIAKISEPVEPIANEIVCSTNNETNTLSKSYLIEQDGDSTANNLILNSDSTDDVTKNFKIFSKDTIVSKHTNDNSSLNQVKESKKTSLNSLEGACINGTEKKIEKNEKHSSTTSTSKSDHREPHKSSSSSHKKSRHKHSHNHEHQKKKETDSNKSKDRSKDSRDISKSRDSINEIPSSTSSNDTQPRQCTLDLQPQARLWRSPGEKKCIEPITPPPFTSSHKFEEAISNSLLIQNSDVKRNKTSLIKKSKHKNRDKLINEKKSKESSSSSLLDTAKDHSESLQNKLSFDQTFDVTTMPNTNDPLTYTSDLFSLFASSTSSSSLSEPMRLVTESYQNGGNESILQRMKEIDVKLLDLQQNKKTIEEKILQLQKDKIDIDQNTMQLQNERFLLLGSLLATRSNVNQNLLPLTINTSCHSMPHTQKDMAKITIVSPNSINRNHQDSINLFSEQQSKNNDTNASTTTSNNSTKRVLGIVDITKDLSAFIKKKRKHSASQKSKSSNLKTTTQSPGNDLNVIDDHNYADITENNDMDVDVRTKRKKTDHQSIDGKTNVKSNTIDSKKFTSNDGGSNKVKTIQKSNNQNDNIPSSSKVSDRRKISNKSQNNDKLNDLKQPNETIQKLSICLTPYKKPTSSIHEISDSEIQILSDSLSNRKDLKRQQSNKTKTKSRKRLHRQNLQTNNNNKSNTTREFKMKKCYVKIARIKSSDYLLNFRGFELNDNVLVPYSSNESDIERVDLKSESLTKMSSTNDGHLFDGQLLGHKTPISFMKIIGKYILAASEDGGIHKYELKTGKLIDSYMGHDKTVTWLVSIDNTFIYSTALDGYLRKINIENNLSETFSCDFKEPLQVMDYDWNTVFIGSKYGKIFVHDAKTDSLSETVLCTLGKAIMSLKTAKEGPRKILIVASRSSNINVRDATTGLLLRSIEVPPKTTIYSILLDGGNIHCGSNQNFILTYDFTNGVEVSRYTTGSSGTICLKMYHKSVLLGASYDGFIYVFDIKKEQELNRIQGPGKPLLHFDVSDSQIVASSKDKSLLVWNIPDEVKKFKQSTITS